MNELRAKKGIFNFWNQCLTLIKFRVDLIDLKLRREELDQ